MDPSYQQMPPLPVTARTATATVQHYQPSRHPTSKRDVGFDSNMLKLENFKVMCGHTQVPVNYPEDKKFGTWVRNVRASLRNLSCGQKPMKDLTEYEKGELIKIGLVPFLNTNEVTKSFKYLVGHAPKFKAQNGHLDFDREGAQYPKLHLLQKARNTVLNAKILSKDKKRKLQRIGIEVECEQSGVELEDPRPKEPQPEEPQPEGHGPEPQLKETELDCDKTESENENENEAAPAPAPAPAPASTSASEREVTGVAKEYSVPSNVAGTALGLLAAAATAARESIGTQGDLLTDIDVNGGTQAAPKASARTACKSNSMHLSATSRVTRSSGRRL